MEGVAGLLNRLRDHGLSERQATNGAFGGLGEFTFFAIQTALVFALFLWIYARGYLPNILPGNPNDLASLEILEIYLGLLWVFLCAVFAVRAEWKRPLILLAAATTLPVLIPVWVLAVLLAYGFALYFVVNVKMPSAFKWTLLIAIWCVLYFGYLGRLEPLVQKKGMEGFAVLLFAAFFLKDVYYLFEKTSVYKHRGDRHPLRDFYIFFLASPFFFNVFHIKPIGYTYFHEKFLERPHSKVARDGVILFAQGILYLLLHAHLFSRWYDWPRTGSTLLITDHYLTMPGWEILLFVYYNFLKVFFILAGNVYLVVGMIRMFGFDIKADFYYPFFAKNLLEHWRRWNIYNRDFVVALIFNPIVFSVGRKINRYLTYFIACMLTFIGGLGILVHLITTTFYVGEARFFVGIMTRTILLGVATTINIWIQLFMSEKKRKARLEEWWAKFGALNLLRQGAKIALTFTLVGSIYFMQQGLTAGLSLAEIGRIFLAIVI